MSLAPQDEIELAELIRDAAARAAPLRLVGADTKRALGRPSAGEAVSLAGFSGVTLYEPEELVLTAGAATPRAEIEALLDAQGQELAFEPIDFGALFGSGSGTIGGLVATGASGPRRIKAGALRDHLLGFRCVTGRGEIVKSGGRVMKNVTGYDLSKLVAGSFGTLAALTEVTLKVLPKAESEATLACARARRAAEPRRAAPGVAVAARRQRLRDAARRARVPSAWRPTPPRSGWKGRRYRSTRGATSSSGFSRSRPAVSRRWRPQPRARFGGACATPSR